MFVLKPQDEGGDHNYYGNDILAVFERCDYIQIKNYILMQLI